MIKEALLVAYIGKLQIFISFSNCQNFKEIKQNCYYQKIKSV